jgi:hypothetical protein
MINRTTYRMPNGEEREIKRKEKFSLKRELPAYLATGLILLAGAYGLVKGLEKDAKTYAPITPHNKIESIATTSNTRR